MMNNPTTQTSPCNVSGNTASCSTTPMNFTEPPHLKLVSVVILSMVDTLCCVLGVVGNGLVLLAIARNKYFRSIPDLFIFSLSSADLLVTAIYVPLLMFLQIFFKELRVNAVYLQVMSFVGHLALLASIASIVGTTTDRLIAIRWPLRYPKLVTKRFAVVSVSITWLISICLSTLNLFAKPIHIVLWIYCTSLLLATIIIYSYIFKVAHTQRKRIVAMRYRNNGDLTNEATVQGVEGKLRSAFKERKAAKTFAIVIGMFVITWIPFLVYLMSASRTSSYFYEGFLWAETVSLCNSFINPYIYCARSHRYRRMVLKMLGVKQETRPQTVGRSRVSADNTTKMTENS